MHKNIRTAGILFSAFILQSMPMQSKDIVIKNGAWRITYAETGKTFNIDYKDSTGKGYSPVVRGSQPEATYTTADGTEHKNASKDFSTMKYEKRKIETKFGKGMCHSFTFSNSSREEVSMTQNFYVYDQDYILTDLSVSSTSGLCSNYLAPICTNSPYTVYTADDDNRMLKVPFDNDSFVRYHKYHLDGEMTSYEVGAVYAGKSRRGIVFGSVEHDHWKSAVTVKASGNSTINSLKVFSGVANEETRDVLPHGKIEGTAVRSALMYIGCHSDWRNGMEEYARANVKVQPGRTTWTGGTPFGWQSWGVMSTHNSFDVDIAVSDYFHSTLNPAGFCNDKGLNIMSIDAWDNLSHEQKEELCRHCEQNGQIAGIYCSPFALWWNEDMLDNKIDNESEYTGRDCVIKVNGQPYKLDGAYCLDPTHPGTKRMISRTLRDYKAEGFKYVKVDFTSNGMVQADSYYNKNVKTAVEAYNEGFSHFLDEADKGEPLFIALSIAPIFPYQYGNSRRIACDTWGKIDQSEYSMNAVCGGWWTNEFYQYNDPDHLVLVGNDAEKETEGENRARVTNGAASGMLLVSDNYSLADRSGCGNAQLSYERAKKILMNRDVNEMGNIGRSFRPVFGYKEHNNGDGDAENSVMLRTEKYLYVAVINYKPEVLKGNIEFERLGIRNGDFSMLKELWSGKEIQATDRLKYEIAGKDAQIFRFTLK